MSEEKKTKLTKEELSQIAMSVAELLEMRKDRKISFNLSSFPPPDQNSVDVMKRLWNTVKAGNNIVADVYMTSSGEAFFKIVKNVQLGTLYNLEQIEALSKYYKEVLKLMKKEIAKFSSLNIE